MLRGDAALFLSQVKHWHRVRDIKKPGKLTYPALKQLSEVKLILQDSRHIAGTALINIARITRAGLRDNRSVG